MELRLVRLVTELSRVFEENAESRPLELLELELIVDTCRDTGISILPMSWHRD